MILQELKEKALELRRSGKSYNFITKETGISSGMLSHWFSKFEWSKDITTKNREKNIIDSTNRIILSNKKRELNLSKKYKMVEEEASENFKSYKEDKLFVGALMLYLGEGDKSLNGSKIRIGNIDPPVIKIFIKFLNKYCYIKNDQIKFWLLSYPDLDTEMCLKYWLNELNLAENNVYKTQIIGGKHKTKRLLYGVGNIILSSKVLKRKILKWIELMSKELS